MEKQFEINLLIALCHLYEITINIIKIFIQLNLPIILQFFLILSSKKSIFNK